MTWLSLCCREWQRRPLRNGITALGVAIAVSALWSLLAFSRGYRDGLDSELDRLGAHVLVVPKGCPYDAASIALHGASWPCFLPQKYLQQVQAVPGVEVGAPVFMNALYEPDGAQAVYVGVDDKILGCKPGWKIDGAFPLRANEILIGSQVAAKRGWKRGDKVLLPGLPNRRVSISGVLAPTQGADDSFIHMRLVDAQKWFGHPQELTHVLVRLRDPNAMEEVVSQLRGCDAGLNMNVVPLAHLFGTIQSLVNSTRLLLGCVALVALLVAAAGVSNALLMAVSERTREIATLRAIGASHSDVFRLFWMQTLQLCLVGGVSGVLLAFAMSRWLEGWLRARLPFAPGSTLIGWDWMNAAGCLIAALVLGSCAGLLPARRAARLAPAFGMRAASGTLSGETL